MPASRLSAAVAGKRIGPVFLESDLADPDKYHRLLQYLTVDPRVVFFCPSRLLSASSAVDLGGGVSLPPESASAFFDHAVKRERHPLFLFVRAERLEETARRVRALPGETPVVLFPYADTGEEEPEILMATQKARLSFVSNMAFLQFLESFPLSGSRLQPVTLDPDSELGGIDIFRRLSNPKSLLPLAASFAGLPQEARAALASVADSEVAAALAARADLTVEEFEKLTASDHAGVLKALAWNQAEILHARHGLARQLMEKLAAQGIAETLEFLVRYGEEKEGAPAEYGFLHAALQVLFRDETPESRLKAQLRGKILENPWLPFWAKAKIVAEAVSRPAGYAEAVCAAMSDAEFLEWHAENALSREDAFSLWLRLVIAAPHHLVLRDRGTLEKLLFHYDMEALRQYGDFLASRRRPAGKRDEIEMDEALVRLLNRTMTAHIPERKKVLPLAPEAVKAAGPNAFASFAESRADWDATWQPTQDGPKKVDPVWVLPLLYHGGGSGEIFDAFAEVYSAYHIRHSRELRNAVANELILLPRDRTTRRLLETLLSLSKKGFKNRKEKQKLFVKILQMANTLQELCAIEGAAFDHQLGVLLDRNPEGLKELYALFEKWFFDLFEKEVPADLRREISDSDFAVRARKILSYLEYRRKWQSAHPEGVRDLQKLVWQYLKTGEDVKKQKYGLDPEYAHSRKQMEVFRAVLESSLRRRFAGAADAAVWEKRIPLMADAYARGWRQNIAEHIFPLTNGAAEPKTIWSTDGLEYWLNLGKEGAYACLGAENDAEMNKMLNGRLLSASTKMVNIGKNHSDKSTRVHESLAYRETPDGIEAALNYEQMFTNAEKSALKEMRELAVVSALSGAARYGVSRIFLPEIPGFPGLRETFLENQAKLLGGYSTTVDHFGENGKLLFREKISVASIRDLPEGGEWIGLQERNPWRIWMGVRRVNGAVPPEGFLNYAVEQKYARDANVEGIPCRAVRLEIPGLEVRLRREVVQFWDEAEMPPIPAALPAAVKMMSLSDPAILPLLAELEDPRLTAGRWLNKVYEATEKLVRFIEKSDAGSGRKELRVIVSIPRGGIPPARKFKQLWRRHSVTGYLRAKNGKILSHYLPPIQSNRRKTVYLIDQVILSGKSIVNCVEELKKNGYREEEIAVVALSAYPQGLENIVRSHPKLKAIYVGAPAPAVTLMGQSGEISHPLKWEENEEVRIGGLRYRLRYRIESPKSFNLFLAQNPDSEKPAVIKTAVSAREGEEILRIGELIRGSAGAAGFVGIDGYDADMGALVMEYVSGLPFGKLMSNPDVSLREKFKLFGVFLEHLGEMTRFLEGKQIYSITFALENILWNQKKQRWMLTNFNVFQSSKTANTKEGLLQQAKNISVYAAGVLLDQCHQDQKLRHFAMRVRDRLQQNPAAETADLAATFADVQKTLRSRWKRISQPGTQLFLFEDVGIPSVETAA